MTTSTKEVIVFDTEVYPNCFLFAAKSLKSGKVVKLWGDNDAEMDHLGKLMNNPGLLWVSFNGNSFDMPIITAAIGGRTEAELKQMCDTIIENRMQPWQSYRDFGIEKLDIDHIDLIEVAPGVMVSLKQYEARLGLKKMQDLPFHHTQMLNQREKELLAEYCINDLDATAALWNKLQEAIELRESMSETYGFDLRSKSDAQMAEAIIVKQLNIPRGDKPTIPRSVRYKAPTFIQPRGNILKSILERVEQHTFTVNRANGSVELPDFLSDEPLHIGNGVYQMGIGGLHSKHDKCVCYRATADFEMDDWDCAAFYPNLILNAKFAPRGLGQPFLDLYKNIVDSRIAAKQRGKMLSKQIAEVEAKLKELDNVGRNIPDTQQG
jgi:hypothetical protein